MNNKSSFKIEIKRIFYNLDLLFYKNGVIIKNRTASQEQPLHNSGYGLFVLTWPFGIPSV